MRLFLILFFISACSPFGQVSVVDIKAPNLAWENSSYDFGSLNLGSMNIATFTLVNTGSSDAIGCSGITLSDTTNFSIDMDNCTESTMTAGQSCTVDIASHPTTLGPKTLTISRACINNSEVTSGANQIVATGSTPPTPYLVWSPLTKDFGAVNVGSTSATEVFTLTNQGGANATGCGNPTISDTTNFTVMSNTCSTNPVTANGGACTFSVRANPTSVGLKSATISRTCSVGGTATTTTNQITTTGVGAPVLAWNNMSTNMGTVNVGSNSSFYYFTLNNTGLAAATVCSAPTITDTINFEITYDGCLTSDLAPSANCYIQVRGRPQSAGLKQATIARTCTVGGTASTNTNGITVTGQNPPPILVWSTNGFNYGNVLVGNDFSSPTIQLSNLGTGNATGCSAPVISDATNFTVINDTCGTSDLNASTSCSLVVRANPNSAGSKTATLSRTCSIGGTVSTTSNQFVVTGVAPSPTLAWSPLTYDFGTMNINTNSSTQVFTLANSGNAAATGCSAPVIADTTNFTITADTCSTSNLNTSSSCDITVRANPTTVGLKQTTISRTCSVGGTVSTTSNQITVTATSPPILAWSPLTNDFGDLFVGIPSAAVRFTLANTGGSAATGCSAPTISDTTNFSIKVDWCESYPIPATSGSCYVDVVAHPMTYGAKQATVSRTCSVGGTVTTTTNQITANGLVSDWRQAFNVPSFNVLKSGATSNNYTYYYRNVGPTALTGCTVPTLSNNTDFTLVSTTCTAGAMSAASMCEAVITANPQSTGNKTSVLSRTCTETGLATTTLDATGDGATYPIKIAAGSNHTCALMNNNTVKCWGSNPQGGYYLGDGTNVDRYSPVMSYAGGGTISDMYVTANDTCLKFNDGSYKCWGSNYYGQLGGYYSTATTIPSFQGYTSLYIGANACGVAADTTVKCWGNNWYGQLGNGNTTGAVLTAPVTVLNVTGAVSLTVSEGYYSSCALINDGTVKCWSSTSGGAAVGGVSSAVELVGGDYARCVRIGNGSPDTGKVKCWGTNDMGQVGNGNNTTQNSAVFVSGVTTATSIAMTKNHACALLSDNTIKCWGNNASGQLGDGTSINRSTPVSVAGISNAVAVTVGASHSCALLSDNSTKCWGSNFNGQLGEGINNRRVIYTTGITNATSIGRGLYHTCAIISGGTIKCWGQNNVGQLGNGTLTNTSTPTDVTGITDATAVSGGYNSTCAIVSGGAVKCWGYNANTGVVNSTPVTVAGITDAVSITVSGSSACVAIGGVGADAGKVKCWGTNTMGQLGDGTNTTSLTPVTALNITNASTVVSGRTHICALLNDSTVKCWGQNYTSTPAAVSGITTAVSIAAGGYSGMYCAVLSSGAVNCKASPGNGSITYNGNALGISNAVAVDIGTQSSGSAESICVLLSDGKVKCWGRNDYGQLGDGTFTAKTIPVYRLNHDTATQLSAGSEGEHHCTIINGGTVTCSGNNIYGQAGFQELSIRTVIGL